MSFDRAAADASTGRVRRLVGAALAYTLLAVATTWPLVRDMRDHIAGDQGDPILNTAILTWNATTVPFSAAWWNAPHYFPTQGVVTFTENLLGLYPVASPVYWLTGNPLLAYNISLLLTWPLSGMAAFLLVRRLSARDDAAFLAGLAFAFNPMRGVAVYHIQTLATFGIPFGLLGLHGYLDERRRRWLVLFGLAWIQQGFANGYYILYGGLIFSLWLAYYCSSSRTRSLAVPMLVAWAMASLALVPMLLEYRRVHDVMGMHRSFAEILYFSASPQSWLEVGDMIALWSRVLPAGKDNLFPGLIVVVLVLAGVAHAYRRQGRESTSWLGPRVRSVLRVLVAISALSILANLTWGPIDTTLGPIPIKMRNLDRALVVLFLAGLPLVLASARTRRAFSGRSHFLFYVIGIAVFAVLACGPILRVHERAILEPAPYGWLMALPGFNELRVPTQIKMIHLLCLAVAAALGFARLLPGPGVRRAGVATALAVGLAAEGWLTAMPLDAPIPMWPVVEPADRAEPILELPLGPGYDGAPTLRAAIHHRRVMNGVSGYDPPYYVALKAGLAAHDPATLAAITSLSAIDVVVDSASDPDNGYRRWIASFPGAAAITSDGARTLFRLPQTPAPPPPGPPVPIVDVQVVRHPETAGLMIDGRDETGWGDYPQKPDEWVLADLGVTRSVGGVTNSIGDFLLDFPRRLVIETSTDSTTWDTAWEGPTFGPTFLGFVEAPRNARLRFSFPSRDARYVRLRQVESFSSLWRVSELTIHAPHVDRAGASSK